MLDTAVLFIIFNRPELTKQVFQAIRESKPKKLYIAADGPRAHVGGEIARCEAARNNVLSMIDWDCEVKTLFRDRNLGCKFGVSTAIDWFFAREEMGIIIEDDVLPHPSFFPYCTELLNKYKNDSRIGMISGDNFQMGNKRGESSYYFSRYTHIWGWATWRRAWQNYDVQMRNWPGMRSQGWLFKHIQDQKVAEYWGGCFDRTYSGEVDTWDYQLSFSMWAQGMHVILPQVNLISNLGFGPDATHTFDPGPVANLPVSEMKFPLIHPGKVERDSAADSYTESVLFNIKPQEHTNIINSRLDATALANMVVQLVNQATEELSRNSPANALELLTQAAQFNLPLKNLNYARAVCFLQLNRKIEAGTALKDELRNFPDNIEAVKLLEVCAV